MTDTKQPEALRLADWITGEEFYGSSDPFINDKMDRVKAELRRQHEEIKCEERRFSELWEQFAALDKVNQELLAANKDSTNHFNTLMADHKKLQGVSQELVEALKEMIHQFDQFNVNEFEARAIKDARAAIAKAEGRYDLRTLQLSKIHALDFLVQEVF